MTVDGSTYGTREVPETTHVTVSMSCSGADLTLKGGGDDIACLRAAAIAHVRSTGHSVSITVSKWVDTRLEKSEG